MKTFLFVSIPIVVIIMLIVGANFVAKTNTERQDIATENPGSIQQPIQSDLQKNGNTIPIATTQPILIIHSSQKTISVLAQTHERKKSLPPQPFVNGPNCINDNYIGTSITIAGGNVNPPIKYADISTDPNFTTFYRKDMTGSISVAGVGGFLLYPDGKKQLLLAPNIPYYIRFYNGVLNTDGYGQTASFSFHQCAQTHI